MPRIIYSLKFDLGRTLTGEIVQLIAPLDSQGQSAHCRPIQKKRVIDLRVGDFIWHRGRSYIIDGIEAYREAWVDQQGLVEEGACEGYVVRIP
jgi:hypothetical protein